MDIDPPTDVPLGGSNSKHWEEGEEPPSNQETEAYLASLQSYPREASMKEDSEKDADENYPYTDEMTGEEVKDEDESSHLEVSEYDDNSPHYGLGLTDLPEEVLERILSFLSPYEDQDRARVVCHQWHRVIKSLIRHRRRTFNANVGANKVGWTEVIQSQGIRKGIPYAPYRPLGISERFSHSCAYLDGSMWVFGGCTNTNTTFNDLWRFDLTSRRWMRPVASGGYGSYPSPKACATMVVYEGTLVLFGGWSQPIPYPLHQSANYFSELHMYNPNTNCWKQLHSIGPEPDALGGHSASIVPGRMVVFGGSPRTGQGSNKVWVYDFKQSIWCTPKIKPGVCPEPRYGQYQTTLDDRHILIMGGCAGPHKIFDDFHILNLAPDCWYWTKLSVNHPEMAPKLAWCSPVCRTENKLVVLCKSQKPRESMNVGPNVYCLVDPPPTPSESSPEEKKTLSPSSPSSIAMDLAESSTSDLDGNEAKRPKVLEAAPAGFNEIKLSVRLNNVFQTARPSDGNPPARGNDVSPRCSYGAEQVDPVSLPSPGHRNLLALQQRLHREYINLPDLDNHQHNPNQDNNIPEGQIHRLQNRSNQNEGNQQHHHHHHHHHHNYQPHQEPNQPHAGQLRRIGHQAVGGAPVVNNPSVMPSIRPNANSNRQRQLEALQRQEELLRSRSKALAEARKKAIAESLGTPEVLEEEIPPTIPVKNHMDVYVADFSSALTTGEVEWKPESQFIPVGSPEETMGCSFVEGRGELIFFGGLLRVPRVPVVQNTVLNKLYILHA